MKRWVLLLLTLCAAACSVKENRTSCQAWCVLYSNGHVAEGCEGDLTCNVATEGESSVERGRMAYESFVQKGDLVLEVPRNEQVYVDVFCGVSQMSLMESVLAIPRGCQCDKIYSGHSTVFIRGEEGEAGLPLNKDYSQISLSVRGDLPGEYPFLFRVLGNVDGFELPGGKPHKGEFDCMPVADTNNVFHVCVPRQRDDSLVLELIHKTDGSPVIRLDFGEMLKEAGFDWSEADLRDINVVVDVAEAAFTVKVDTWDVSDIETVIL